MLGALNVYLEWRESLLKSTWNIYGLWMKFGMFAASIWKSQCARISKTSRCKGPHLDETRMIIAFSITSKVSSHSWNKRENILQTAGRARSAQKQRAIRLFPEQKTNCIGQFGKERAKRSLRKGCVYISIDMYTHTYVCMYTLQTTGRQQRNILVSWAIR